MHMRYQFWELCTLQKLYNLNTIYVIAMSSNHPTIGETKEDPLSSPKLSLIPKGTQSLIHGI
jgi:hypothetical protein